MLDKFRDQTTARWKQLAWTAFHWAWRRLPLSIDERRRVQAALFRLLPWFFKYHPAFPLWESSRRYKPPPLRAENGSSSSGTILDPRNEPLAFAPPVKVVAFYLPQFHPIPENDLWWGRGFTEWINVVQGHPQFSGHYQPHLPGELGFYDLRVPAVQRRQVELAKLYGIGGFAFYFYWFSGKTLLEDPILSYLCDRTLDLPFCLCWANENWSRRWDGRDQDTLIEQVHSSDDDVAFIQYISKYLRDDRYLRVSGHPLLILYRPDLLPDAAATVKRWRCWCKENGIGEIYVAFTESFESTDPQRYGMDAAIEFPPNNSGLTNIAHQFDSLDPGFEGSLCDWTALVQHCLSRSDPGYRLFRGVNPGWDNTARRKNKATILIGSSSERYQHWLEQTARETIRKFPEPSERLVFVNAWNEWAEGAHLEPDRRHGYAHLDATREALLRAMQFPAVDSVMVVTHDAHPHGAQFLALNILRTLQEEFGYKPRLLALKGGELIDRYRKYATVDDLSGYAQDGPEAFRAAARLRAEGVSDAIVNSTASGLVTAPLRAAGIRTTVLVHELPLLLRQHQLRRHAIAIARNADEIIFPTQQVKQGFFDFAQISCTNARIRPQGLYRRNRFRSPSLRERARAQLRRHLRLASEAKIILGAGYGDHRKGLDLFVEAGIVLGAARNDVYLVWIGRVADELEAASAERIRDAGLETRFHFPGFVSDTDPFFAGADVFAMTSREDPFPSVVLEALDAGLPVVGFDRAGGFIELAGSACVLLVPPFDTEHFARTITELLHDRRQRRSMATVSRSLIDEKFGFRRYLFDLLLRSKTLPPRVSVIIPNYNYRRFLERRLDSVLSQSIPIFELIVLDDGSTDGSREWLQARVPVLFPEAQLLLNDRNSGSVFSQWLRGVEQASGDFIWIAEADDQAEPGFLQAAVRAFVDDEVVLSYTQSKQTNAAGTVVAEDYSEYVADISTKHWSNPYVVSGDEEIRHALAVKNTIPNASAVLFRRKSLLAILRTYRDKLTGYKVAGDWIIYVELLRGKKIAFDPSALNIHRRHEDGVTISRFNLDQLIEIMSVQQWIRDTTAVDPDVVDLALQYAENLYQQFGLASAAYPTVRSHPALERFICYKSG